MLLIHRYNTPILTVPSLHFTALNLMWEDRLEVRCDKFWKMEIAEPGIPEKHNNYL
jgi:hypothetical protein